jgi:hypothetical protein
VKDYCLENDDFLDYCLKNNIAEIKYDYSRGTPMPTHHAAVSSTSGKYVVMVDDNYHHMDESERYKHGEYNTCEEAVNACKQITIDSLKHCYKEDMTAEELYENYMIFGDDPFILSEDKSCEFSAWDFAKSYSHTLVSSKSS